MRGQGSDRWRLVSSPSVILKFRGSPWNVLDPGAWNSLWEQTFAESEGKPTSSPFTRTVGSTIGSRSRAGRAKQQMAFSARRFRGQN